MLDVENAVQVLQFVDLASVLGQRSGVDQLVVFVLRLNAVCLQPLRVHKGQFGGGRVSL